MSGSLTPTGCACYYAQPYALDAGGFFFSDWDDYQAQLAACHHSDGRPVEEFKIHFIDGDNHALFNAIGVTQANLTMWFEQFESVDADDDAYAILVWLIEQGEDPATALTRTDDFSIFEGSPADYAAETFDQLGYDLPACVRRYIDHDAIARDMVLEGSIHEIGYHRLIIGMP